MGGALANTLELAAAGCVNACRPRRLRLAVITLTKDRRWSRTTRPTRYTFHAAALRQAALSITGAFSLIVVGARPGPHQCVCASAAVMRDTESAISPCGAVRPKASLSSRESWQCPAFMAATVQQKQFPLRGSRISRETNSFCLPVLHCVLTASGAASPFPAGRITTRTRWRELV